MSPFFVVARNDMRALIGMIPAGDAKGNQSSTNRPYRLSIGCFAWVVRYNDRMKTKTKYSPLEQMIDGLSKCLTPESAKQVLKFRADAKLQKHLHQLADKCTEGTLTPEERSEYGDCVTLGTFLAILQSKIRQKLAQKGE